MKAGWGLAREYTYFMSSVTCTPNVLIGDSFDWNGAPVSRPLDRLWNGWGVFGFAYNT